MELEVCWSVEVIKGGFTGILRLVLSLSVISISLLSNFSDICFASSIFESFRSDFFTFNLKVMFLSSCFTFTSISQYSSGEKALISLSFSTTSFTATDWTLPAESFP